MKEALASLREELAFCGGEFSPVCDVTLCGFVDEFGHDALLLTEIGKMGENFKEICDVIFEKTHEMWRKIEFFSIPIVCRVFFYYFLLKPGKNLLILVQFLSIFRHSSSSFLKKNKVFPQSFSKQIYRKSFQNLP